MKARAAVVLVGAILLRAAAARGAEAVAPPPARSLALQVGAQLGFPHIVGASTTATFFVRGRPRFDVDFLWEPSGGLQSYSFGSAYHPADRMFFLGTRLRLLQLRAPWERGFAASVDHDLGIGLEAGLRARVGPGKRVVIHFALQATGLPTEAPNLRWLIGLSLGVGYTVLERSY